ncbi:MAG TPA: hypothetical protein ENK11_02870 [Phycisphaerales bacterium]|nr:hypothetical protein [Phycisphaerales bacterium]
MKNEPVIGGDAGESELVKAAKEEFVPPDIEVPEELVKKPEPEKSPTLKAATVDPDFKAAMERPMKFGDDGRLEIHDDHDLKRVARLVCASQSMRISGANTPADTALAIMCALEAGLPSTQAVKNVMVVNGKPAIFGDALMSIVLASRELKAMSETFDDETMTATCRVVRVQKLIDGSFATRETVRTFSKEDAETAKLWGKPGPWSQYPKRMMQMRARAFALRDAFADRLGGLSVEEDSRDIPNPNAFNPDDMRGVEKSKILEAAGIGEEGEA